MARKNRLNNLENATARDASRITKRHSFLKKSNPALLLAKTMTTTTSSETLKCAMESTLPLFYDALHGKL
jgi:hypothetical protein